MTLPVIIDSAIVSADQWSALQAIASELSDTFSKRQIFRTETEARISVLDDIRRPTRASKYWQAVREQAVMLEQLAMLSFEFRRNETAIKRHERRLAACEDDLDAEDAKTDLDEAQFKRASMMTTASDRVRELLMWSKLKAELDDGSFNTEDCDQHQLVSYTARFLTRASVLRPEHMSGDEWSNLIGQIMTGIRRCKEVGAMDALLVELSPSVVDQLKIGGIDVHTA